MGAWSKDEKRHRAVSRVGPVEGDLVGAVVEALRAAIEVVSAPQVVCLPGGHPEHQHDLAGGRWRAHGYRHVPLAAGGVQPQQVRARRPARVATVRLGRHGAVTIRVAGLIRAARLYLPGHPARCPHLPRPHAAIPAHPERLHAERRRRGGHVQAERLAGEHADPVRETLDRVRRAEMGDVPAPGPGRAVLGGREGERRGRGAAGGPARGPRPGGTSAGAVPGRTAAGGQHGDRQPGDRQQGSRRRRGRRQDRRAGGPDRTCSHAQIVSPQAPGRPSHRRGLPNHDRARAAPRSAAGSPRGRAISRRRLAAEASHFPPLPASRTVAA